MKSRIWIAGVAVCLALGGAWPGSAAVYYVNDNSSVNDVYTSGLGNDVNSGTNSALPKLTLNSVLTNAMAPGDVVYIDTGTYTNSVVIGTGVNGAAGTRIVFQGVPITNPASGGTVFSPQTGYALDILGDYLHFQDIRTVGGSRGLNLNGSSFGEYQNIFCSGSTLNPLYAAGISSSNAFRRCIFTTTANAAAIIFAGGDGNYVEHSIAYSLAGSGLFSSGTAISNVVSSIIVGDRIVTQSENLPSAGSYNILRGASFLVGGYETLAELHRANTNWHRNTVADPQFVNAGALDFHLLSTAGYATNGGGGVTNLATAHSPAIDFGARSASVGAEPVPNGGRVNVGLYGGTAEASKSNTNNWLFAMSFNDGGTLMQTGRLEWTASTNFGAAGTVDLQYTTNNWTTTNAIATGVLATNESYVWAPAFSYQAVQWRVVSSANPAVASTNAKPFSIRRTTNTMFTFYVNDGSTAGDVYGMGLGNAANDGAEASRPKDTLQAIVNAYQLRGGDVIYIDTGAYPGQTTTIGVFDSGSAGLPVRIVGSPNGSVFDRGNPTMDVLDISGASHLEIENLRLAGGRYGLNGGVANVTLRNLRFTGNASGVFIMGSGHVFENCVAADNTARAFWGSGSGFNQWRNGVMWGSPTIIHAQTNTVTVSNSILVGNGPAAALFGNNVVRGDFNLVWNTGVGTHSTFTALQDAGLGLGWTNSGYADPQFANATGGDFHLKSLMGRYDTNTATFVTNDAVHSPAIDLGGPSASFALEPSPHGDRLNAGLYGNTAQASKSRTNAWIQLLNYQDGGTLDAQAGAYVRWNAGEFEPGAKITIWLSRNGGGAWEALATNVSVAGGIFYYLDPIADNTSSRLGILRVELEGASLPAWSQSATNFTYRNGKFSFYVNDDYSTNDVYCTASGNDANSGASPADPMRNLHALVNMLGQLGAGDRIYIDTGVYTATNTVKLTSAFSGAPTNLIVIAGSTNRQAGGSRFQSGGSIPRPLGFDFQTGASNIVLRDVVVSNVVRGVAMTNTVNVVLDGVEVRGATSRAFDLQGNARSNQLIHCVAHGGSTGVYLQNTTNVSIRHSLFWQNTAYAVNVAGSVGGLMENCILASTSPNAALLLMPSSGAFSSDYNGLHAGPLTRVGSYAGTIADNLAAWARLSGQDSHSIPGNPQMADPDQYDYHLKTEQTLGRLLPTGLRTSDSVSSPLLDAGNPASTGYTNEPAPNGNRINVGRWGGTPEASIAVNSLWLKTVSFGDAGIAMNGGVPLVWTAGGGFSNQTVEVKVSADGGATWVAVATGIAATNERVIWNLTGALPDTPAGIWQVTCLENTNVWARSTTFFPIRNSPLNLFVNGPSTNNAVYASGPGRPDNWTASSAAPLNSVATVFERFDLEPGDQVWVDRGTYVESATISIGMKNSGTVANPIRVTGIPSAPYSGTVLARDGRSSGMYGFQLAYANGVRLSDLMVSNTYAGIFAENSQGIGLDRVRAAYCFTNAIYAGVGVQMDVTRAIVEQSLSAGIHTRTGAVVKIYNSLFRDNSLANLVIRGGNVEVKNSIMDVAGDRRYAYYWGGSGTLVSDYNNIRVSDGANVAGGDIRAADRFLIDWQTSTAFANDKNSFGYAPRFANPSALDFHLMSEHGRWVPTLAAWTNDTETSTLIDLGVPPSVGGEPSVYTNEPPPNGSRINVGLYGNTAEASKSSGTPTLVPLTMSDGGTIRGAATLYWSWNGFSGNEYVWIQFSGDGGTTWTNLDYRYVNVGSSGFAWDTTNVVSTAMGVWRVVLDSDTNVYGQTETLFAIKNQALPYYINDGSTNGDVYCSSIGRATNTGLSADAPLNSLATLLANYKIEHGDTIYVDTGLYPRSSPLAISVPAVAPTNYLVIQGSTNEAAGGSIFTNSSGGAVIELQSVQNVELRDLRLHGGSLGLLLTQSSSNHFYRVRSVGSRGNAFDLSTLSDQNRFIQCAALNFSRTGLAIATPSIASQSATNHWVGGVISPVPASSNGTALGTGVLVAARSGGLYISNSVFVANSPAHDFYSVAQGVVRGDYNAYHRPYADSMFATLFLGNLFGVRTVPVEYFPSWVEWNQSDSNSLMADPLFVDLAGGDLHPRSTGGRYVPSSGSFVEDLETSPLIDTADPAMALGAESAPNGNRANIGIYGGTEFASRTSPTNGTFVLRSFNQGGIASGVQTLRWIPQGETFTTAVYTVYIQVSTNSGDTFQTVGTNAALAGSFAWNTTAHPSLPTIRWRLQCVQKLDWIKSSERDFTIRNAPSAYYVNDSETNRDVYCSAVGNATNTGLRADSPLDSLAAVLARFDLESGDVVWIDTGNYPRSTPTEVGYLDSGTAATPIVIQGSTNYPGTVFLMSGIHFENAKGIQLRNVQFQSPDPAGAEFERSEDISLEHVDVRNGGVTISICSNVLLHHFSAAWATNYGLLSEASFNTRLEFGTIWSNRLGQILVREQPLSGNRNPDYNVASVSVSNCILGSYGIRIPIYALNGNLRANHNNLYLADGGLVALSTEAGFNREIDSVGTWVNSGFGQDSMSLSHDPLFVNAGAGDFHLQSTAGHWIPEEDTWLNDPQSSPLIDAGDSLLVCSEPAPNGNRVNLGRYGNTVQASRTPAEGALTLISFNDGGRASGTNVMVSWLARGPTTNATVTISYSSDGGSNWTVLASGLSASDGSWAWNSTLSAESVEAKLKIEASDGSLAASDRVFSVRNGTFAFYLNDDSQTNDVYCTAVGLDGNNGLSPDKPMQDFNALLAKYDLEGGDIVYIDTGIYQKGADPWRITQNDSAGNLGVDPVIFQGSTNSLMNGTVLSRSFNTVGIRADYAVGIRLRNLTVSNTASTAVQFNDCYDAAAEWVAVGNANLGIGVSRGSHMRIERCAIVGANRGILVSQGLGAPTNTVYPVIEHNAIWETDGYAIQYDATAKLTVRHNLLSVKPGRYVYGGSGDELTADYNSIWLGDSGRVFYQEAKPVPLFYTTVGEWSALTGQDLHSYDGDPLLANPVAWDFHLMSRAGRWDPVQKDWLNDMVSSPLIDLGDPDSAAWANEPTNNGRRVNVGLYGGTGWASKSETNSALYVLTLNRGGVASGQVALNWMASGAATGHTVRLEVSIDDGATWSLVASGLAASLQGITWNSASLPSSPLGRWRVQDEDEPAVVATSELPFVLHNGPIYYYVNDDDTYGDVYCTTNGDASHSGLSPDSPKRWISQIVDAYDLEPGDVIYVDTGFYQTPTATTFGELDAGDLSQAATRQVNVVGSTNKLAGGSVYILSNPQANAFHLDNTYGIRFSHLGVLSASNGIYVESSYYVAGDGLDIQDCHNGIAVNDSSNAVFRHSTLVGNRNAGFLLSSRSDGAPLEVGSCVLWSNRYGMYLDQGLASVSNSVFGMPRPNSFGIYVRSDAQRTGVRSDYNSLYVPPQSRSAVAAYQIGDDSDARTSVFVSVSSWSAASEQDVHSLAHDPQLADPGNGDFHLKSPGGRYLPGTGWVTDPTAFSPLIDSGPPQSIEWQIEPSPNGERLNIGLYGGTPEASKTPLSGWLTLLTLNDGGTATGAVDLKWAVGGDATNHTACIEYSPDDGLTWVEIVCGWPAGTGSYLWNSVPFGRSALGRWRIISQNNFNISAESLSRFVLRNGGEIPYFVNDSSTNGDVYCTAVGNDANDGLTASRPKASLQAILDAYDLDPVDIVYVDSGNYVAGLPPIKIDQTDSGWSNLYVTVQGSTNPAAPSVFRPLSFSAPTVFSLEYAVNVRLKDLTIRDAQVGVSLSKTIGCELDSVRIENNRSAGLALFEAVETRLIRSLLWKNNEGALGNAATIDEGSLAVENSVLWGSPTAIDVAPGSRLTVTNSVLNAAGAASRIYQFESGGLNNFSGDYNSYTRVNDALICEQVNLTPGAGNDLFDDLPSFSAATSSDRHSMTLGPEFANVNTGDFHPKSTGGRYASGAWSNDAVLSPLVDAGSLLWPFDNEPEPNGDFVNIGMYGNTSQASMTQTNPPWLRAVSYNDEGVMSADVLLYWLHGGLPEDALVRLDYSTEYGISWVNIASNVPAKTREYLWDVRSLPLSLGLIWRVVLQSNTNVLDATDQPVLVKTGTYDYFVNDGGPTNVDVYCAGPGLPLGAGANPTNRAFPINSLVDLLRNYPVAAGDRVFVDTGVYPVTAASAVIFDGRNLGSAAAPLKIHGSTNWVAGGTRLLGNGTTNGITIRNTRFIALHDLRIEGGLHGISLQNAGEITMTGMELFKNRTNGLSVAGVGGMELRNSRIWGNGQFGYYSTGSKGGERLNNVTIWGNPRGVASTDKGLSISNSILCVTNAAPIFVEENQTANISGDYNLFGMVSNSIYCSNLFEQANYVSLRQWQDKGRDLRSFRTDPRFVDPANGDFHLQSRAGYWSNGTWAVSTGTSWAIDAGDPTSTSVTNESAPNGARVNLGAYGGTPQASRSDSSVAELLLASLVDGGVAPDGQPLYWVYRGINPSNTISIYYSPNNGADWVLVNSGIRIDSAPYFWFSTLDPTPEALWRVDLSTNVMGATSNVFTLRTRGLVYYVNDTNRTGDVYTDAIGAATNRGYVSNSPLNSIQAVLDRYQLSGGDEVKVDTGVYILSEPAYISLFNSGDPTNKVKYTGSTNLVAGGSWLQSTVGSTNAAFRLFNARDVLISNFRLTGFFSGVSLGESSRCTLSDLDIQGSTDAGVQMNLITDILLERVLIRTSLGPGVNASGGRFALVNSVVWSNGASAITMGNGSQLQITNTVLGVFGEGRYCYESLTNIPIQADYNDLLIRNNAQIAAINQMQYEKLPQWVRGSSQDRHSLSTDPLFADPANGDFHLKSSAGRYQVSTGWVQDVYSGAHTSDVISVLINTPLVFSPLIDMGAPQAAWSNEPLPNGSRGNIGLYGNTIHASKSYTNAWLQAVTAMSGGMLEGGINLVWGYGGSINPAAKVQVEYSNDDGGSHWIRIGEAAVGLGGIYWQSDLMQGAAEIYPSSPAGRWRLYLLSNSNVVDRTDTYSGLNPPFEYYVNDSSTNDDVWATSAGDDTLTGFYPDVPKRTLRSLLQDLDIEPGDQIFVDTGTYEMSDTNLWIRWESSDGGTNGLRVTLRGSSAAAGSTFIATNAPTHGVFFRMEASHMELRDLRFVGESMEFMGNGLVVSNLSLTNRPTGNVSMLLSGNNATLTDVQIDRGGLTVSGANHWIERLTQRWGATALGGVNMTLLNSVIYATNHNAFALDVNAEDALVSHCTVVASRGTALRKRGIYGLRAEHNILVAGGSETNSAIMWEDGGLFSDWNNLRARDSAWIGSRNGKWEKLAYWQLASGQDANSVSFETTGSFQNETAGDFHLYSVAGRWSPFLNRWDTDTVHSVLIDLGDPAIGTGNEEMPNGYRPNLGAYGRTHQASKSRTSMWATALSHNDGGVLKGSNVVLRWAGPVSGSSASYRLEYSFDGGGTWSTIATGQGTIQGVGTYSWNTAGFPDTFNGLWRVVAEDGSGGDTNDAVFALRNTNQIFYVNDNNYDPGTDVYTTAPGNNANNGLTPATPKATLQAILDFYDLEGGDVVCLDSGTYSTNADIRVNWSRGGDENADVVIQGNPYSPYATVLDRSGSVPAIGLDVKASYLQVKDMNVRGNDRAIRLESNRYVTVQGVVLSDASTGVDARGVQDATVRNSGFWKTGIGINLLNASRSVLENLTFVVTTNAGIQLQNTELDTLQNNVFIPAEGTYAYSIGDSVSLLANAEMDYNLYDFGRTNTGFYFGSTNYYTVPTNDPLRRWQVGNPVTNGFAGMNGDFRSAIADAGLPDGFELTGDFHPRSVYGRWTATANGGEWTMEDTNTSWAVDHGNPSSDYSAEQPDNGGRINLGMYGNTAQASLGSTNVSLEARTLSNPDIRVTQNDQVWPMIWSAHLLGSNDWVLVQFSGDGGLSWIDLTPSPIPATTEYYIWQATIQFSSAEAYWRVISTTNSGLAGTSDDPFIVQYRDLGIVSRAYPVAGLMRFDWEGGIQGMRYEIRYSDDFGRTWLLWDEKYNGPAMINKSNFVIPVGGSRLIYTFEDRTSYLKRTRWYRIYGFKQED